MNTRRGALIAAVLLGAVALAGCFPSSDASLQTPSTALTYGWVMAYDGTTPGGQGWGVQIGPKVDGSGTHVAVYGWQNCAGTVCDWEFFHEYDELAPGSVHHYAVVWGTGGWQLQYDGATLVVLDPGGPAGTVFETNPAEHTAS